MKPMAIDKTFYKKFFLVSIPIAVQQLLKSLMYFIDNIMIGSLGENAIVGVGNANQIAFFISVLMFGVCSTGWVFAARYNGEGDSAGIKKTLGFCLSGTIIIGFIFFVLSLTIPGGLISIFNPLPGVVKSGGDYLNIVGVSYIFTGISLSYASVLKGCEKTKLPMVTSIISICVNAGLNYVLIYGKFGFPELGVKGAAIGTVIGCFLDAVLIVVISYVRGNELSAKLRELFPRYREAKKLVLQFVKVGTPIIINEFLWALYAMVLVVLYNKMGMQVATAMMVFSALDRLAYVVYVGIAHSSGVMVGNQLGEGNKQKAYEYGKRFLKLAPISTIVVGLLIIASLPLFLAQYDISASTLAITKNVVYTFAAMSWLVTINFTNIIGVLRGGGDTRFAMKIDLAGCWLITLPIGFFCGLVLHMPAHLVYFCALFSGDIFKFIFGIHRFKSKKWMHDITSVTHE